MPDDHVTRIIDTDVGGKRPRRTRRVIDLDDDALSDPIVIDTGDLPARVAPEIVISDRDVGEIAARQARERLRLGTAAPPSIQLRVTIGSLERRTDVVVRGTADVAARVLSRSASERMGTAVTSHRLWCLRRRCWLAESLPLHAAGVLWGDRLLLHTASGLPTESGSAQAVTLTRTGDAGAGGALTGRLDFNRPPRVARPVAPLAREVRAPPEPPRKPRVPWIAVALPLLIGIPMYFVVGPMFLIFLALMPMMSIGTYFSERRGGRKDFEEASAEFEQLVLKAQAELQEATAAEAAELRRRAPAPGIVVGRARKQGDGLWERRRTDGDFGALRVGLADQPTSSRVTIARGGAEHLRTAAQAKLDIRLMMSEVPVLVRPLTEGAVGVCGEPERVAALARWFAIQAATLHSPADLVIGAVVGHDQAEYWDWLKWLPHASDERSPFESAPRALGDIEARELLEHVRELCTQRTRDRTDRTQAIPDGPAILLFIDERVRLERVLVAELLKHAPAGDVAVVWLGSERKTLPGECAVIVELPFRRSNGRVVHAATGATHDNVAVEGSTLQEADVAARALAPLRDMSAGGRAAAIPRRIALLELLAMPEPSAADVVTRWAFAPDSLEAPIGATAGRQHVVDLRAHGPHALVAGTTGSGKSELLRSWIASLAMTHPPNRLTFLLVDYKGGAAFGPCVHLPHVVELVTDLDERLVQRALISLDAELHRREALLADARAKDLLELQRRMPDLAPPALVIVVDEFAKLREEVPEFVDGVVDVAQRGRSLGVHMILAAQSLRNAFTPAIRANTNLRIALRVSDENESDDVISAKDAARIPAGPGHTGRGFTRTGHGMLDEFQTAYVSGRTRAGTGPELTVWGLTFGGGSEPVAGEDGVAVSDEDTDLTALASAAQAARTALALPLPAGPWLPPLPDILSLGDVPQHVGDDRTGAIAIGLIDDPARQAQDPLELHFESAGNVVVFGGGGSGKSTLLRTCAVALATSAPSDDVHIYAIDGPGRRLATLGGLPHCGGVAPFDDAESVDALLALLARRIEARSSAFAAAGVTSLSEARARDPQTSPPRIVLLIDDIGAFLAAHDDPRPDAAPAVLERLMATGRGVGVHVVATAERRGALPTALAATIGERLMLDMANRDDMINLGIDPRVVRTLDLQVGRGLTADSLEFHVAIPGHAADGASQADALQRLCRELRAEHGDRGAPPIPVLPADIPLSDLPADSTLRSLPVGLGTGEGVVIDVDLSELHLLVAGPYRTGRTTTLSTIASALRAVPAPPAVHLLAPRRSSLTGDAGWASVSRGLSECTTRIDELLALAEARDADTPEGPIVIIIDDAGELSDMQLATKLERIVRLGRDVDIRIVAAAETAAVRGFGGPSWLRELRKDGNGILLRPEFPDDSAVLNTPLPRRARVSFPPGRGVAIRAGTVTVVQIAR